MKTIVDAVPARHVSEDRSGAPAPGCTPVRRGLAGVAPLLAFSASLALVLALALSPRPALAQAEAADCPRLLRHTFNSLQTGEPRSLCQYRGKVLLVVNTASFCGYTRQYEGLEALYRKHRDRGLVVLGFPSNDFGAQEPGSNKEIAEFCRTTYGIEFPLFEKPSSAKLTVNPFYAELIRSTGQAPQWNFHKYLVDRSGTRVQSFGSGVEPGERDFVRVLERLLAEKPAA
jgi:glutathione peroxidase